MRALLAIGGLLVLAGSAMAAKPTAHTLRKSASGPIVAVAQDNTTAAWLTSSYPKACNAVHLTSPRKKDRSLPQPSSPTMTCRWNVANVQSGQSQLAVASKITTALWTLHENGPYFDQIVAATAGGPERQIERLSHASDGTGDWLGGVAGAGKTLAYSWDDVEYVDPIACLSKGGKWCKEKIADGGIRLVTRTTDSPGTPLPGAGPATLLAASAGRIAYVPATTVHGGHPYTTANNTLQIVDAASGTLAGQASVHGFPIAMALSPHVLAVLTTQGTPHDRITWFSAANGTKLGSVVVSGAAAPQLAANDHLIVYRVGLLLRDVATRNGHIGKLVKTGQNYVGLSFAGGRLMWAENHNGAGRLRALAVG